MGVRKCPARPPVGFTWDRDREVARVDNKASPVAWRRLPSSRTLLRPRAEKA